MSGVVDPEWPELAGILGPGRYQARKLDASPQAFAPRAARPAFGSSPCPPTGDTARWNCLSYVSDAPDRRINDIQRIADILYAESPGTDPFWVASARSLFLGICLYLFETQSFPKTMGEVRRQGMASDDEGFGAHWKRIVQGRQSGKFPLSAECVRALYDVIDLAPVTASSVRKTFTSRLDLWANPLLDRATSADDFDLRDLRKKPMSIYVCVNPDDLHRLRPVLSLFFQQTIGLQTTELPEHNPALKYQLLMLLERIHGARENPDRERVHVVFAGLQRADSPRHSSALATARGVRAVCRRDDVESPSRRGLSSRPRIIRTPRKSPMSSG